MFVQCKHFGYSFLILLHSFILTFSHHHYPFYSRKACLLNSYLLIFKVNPKNVKMKSTQLQGSDMSPWMKDFNKMSSLCHEWNESL
ncbi:hypothetical protein Pint_26347 [Pistacia integerrima]|uniref:Uncharacterized protein n=1 Tax=Pistacia integerrima TaxID=434235 RepID=A0ACC0YDM6_9ROSI|nr:hypothetical protein Pint_26347 [Pistacia integerrima]